MSSVFPPSGSASGQAFADPAIAANWHAQLRPASFGGVPFGVLGGQIRVGRRNAVHEFPFRDQVWVEDLGRAARRITLTGFLVENGRYAGGRGSVIAQRERLIAICEGSGVKTLIHPTLGQLKVSLLDTAMEERWDQGRVFEITFVFVESGERVFPSTVSDSRSSTTSAAAALNTAATQDFAARAQPALLQGAAVADIAARSAAGWATKAQVLVGDATNLMSMAGQLSGSFGRFVGGRTRIIGSIGGALSSATTVAQLAAKGTTARAAVTTAAQNLGARAAVISA